MSASPELVNCETWGNGDIRAHHKWWFSLFPHVAGVNEETGKYNNWWVYFTLDYLTQSNGICGDNLTWKYVDKTLTISGTGAMYNYGEENLVTTAPWKNYSKDLRCLIIEPGVTEIGTYAFRGCEALETVSLPNTLLTINDLAFNDCRSLNNVIIPDSVTSINNWAFSYCTELDNIALPNRLPVINDCVLYGCIKLNSVTIPSSVREIGSWAFSGCDNLEDVYYLGSTEQWNNITIGGANGNLLDAKIHFSSTNAINILFGDANGDGKVTSVDRAFIARYLAKWSGYDSNKLNMEAADLNGDNKVTSTDRMILARHLAKWSGYTILPYKR